MRAWALVVIAAHRPEEVRGEMENSDSNFAIFRGVIGLPDLP
jgi:hypothetical protein